uniref:UDP-glucuronate decarboxylase n=1 Tax=Ananas comosus var. bracteatus TaxID=296719 RepID=A0A6V7QXV5_ANACO
MERPNKRGPEMPAHPSKGAKGSSRAPPTLVRSAAAYILREQRLLFVLIGAFVASTLFFLHPYLSSSSSSSLRRPHLLVRPFSTISGGGGGGGGGGGRVPVGLRKPPLRIVVTGGAGFVGSHLVDKLIARGDSVIVVDNFFTGRKENVAHHLRNPRFELIRHDVVEPILLEVDQIYHLACPASPVHYKHNPIKTIISFSPAQRFFFFFSFLGVLVSFLLFKLVSNIRGKFVPKLPRLFLTIEYKTNVMGTLNMLGLSKRIGARFLLTSTSEVYGDPLEHPQKETYWGNVNPIGVRSCYDEGKRTAETLTMDYHRGADVEVRIARIFNTYGPRMCIDDGRVVSNFVAQALRRQPMTVYGDGKQTRSFQYVSDLVDGLVALMEGDHIGPFNLGNPGEFTMLELAKVVKETIDPSATIEFRPNTADDPHMRKPDITKAKQLLNWEPKISLREGLPLMVTDFRQRVLSEQS